MERLEMAVSELEYALEMSANLPITAVSLLRRRKMFKLAYVEGTESIDILGVAIQCLRFLGSQFKLATQSAIGELTLLANLHDIFHSYDHCDVVQEVHIKITQLSRPDPLCCTGNRHRPCAKKVITPEPLHVLPEQVIYFFFRCCMSAPEYRSYGAKRNVTRDLRPPLEMTVVLTPHLVVTVTEGLQGSFAVEIIGGTEEIKYMSMQEVTDIVRSQAIVCFLRQPELMSYEIYWASEHDAAFFIVKKRSTQGAGAPITSSRYNTRSSTKRRRR